MPVAITDSECYGDSYDNHIQVHHQNQLRSPGPAAEVTCQPACGPARSSIRIRGPIRSKLRLIPALGPLLLPLPWGVWRARSVSQAPCPPTLRPGRRGPLPGSEAPGPGRRPYLIRRREDGQRRADAGATDRQQSGEYMFLLFCCCSTFATFAYDFHAYISCMFLHIWCI